MKHMNEAQTRFNKIDPKLRDAGWDLWDDADDNQSAWDDEEDW